MSLGVMAAILLSGTLTVPNVYTHTYYSLIIYASFLCILSYIIFYNRQ